MVLCILVRRNHGEKSPVSIKCHIPHSFKGVILLCESILLYNPFNPAVPVLYKMAKHTLKILQHLLQGF